jgi:hypothetical protein
MTETPQLTDLELAKDIKEVAFLTAQTPMENNDSSEVEDPLPEGYSAALADCPALAVNLLQRPSMERRLIAAGIAQVGVVAALRASLTRQLATKHVKASNTTRWNYGAD